MQMQMQSLLVQSSAKTGKNILLAKVLGSIFCPVGGLCCCIIPACMFQADHELVKKTIALYTPEVLNTLAPLVVHQVRVFIDACMQVNWTLTHNGIFPKVTLIDMICAADETAGQIIRGSCVPSFSLSIIKQQKDEYLKKVAAKFQELGGNTSVIIYGLPEYMCHIVDPTSPRAMDVYRDLVVDGQLQRLVLAHRDAALNNNR